MIAPFSVPHVISVQQVHDQLITAFEQGSGYWMRWDRKASVAPTEKVSAVGDANVYPYADWPLTGGNILVLDCEDGKKAHTLNREAIQSGLEVMAAKYPRHFAALVGEDGDAETADVFLQCCVLGEVVYG